MSQGFFAQFRGTAPSNTSSSFASDTTTDMSASRKRGRDADDVDGEVEIESASSSFRQNMPKRSRLALAAANGGSVVSDDEEEDGINGDSAYQQAAEEIALDISDIDSEDDGAYDLRATQIIEKELGKSRINIAMESGVVDEVFCRNFMCHNKLRIKLGPNINFIIGHNGSGKSAVLTALTMCLGGKATATNRGANLKSLIKEGEEGAMLAVKLKNGGDMAYKPELYGNSITVERHFSRAGTSGFKIKNAEDKTISTKRSELDDITDFYGLQLENPINVLTQDMARQFLSNSTAGDKYKFFIRGTQLETLDHDYNLMEERLDSILGKLASREEDVAILEGKAAEALGRKKRLDDARKIEKQKQRYTNMHAWAQVEEQEATLATYVREVEQGEEIVTEREQDAERLQGAFEGNDQAHEAAKAQVEQLQEQLRPVEEQRDAEKEIFNAKRQEIEVVMAQHRQMREGFKKFRTDEKNLGEKIREEQARIAGSEGAEHGQRSAKLEELKGRVEEAKRGQEEHQESLPELNRNRDITFKALEDVKPTRDRLQDDFERARSSLSGMQSAQRRPYDGYRQNMDQLVRAINNETRWRSKPVGPMGKHIRLQADKTQWIGQIEKTFGGQLEAFVVTNGEDHKLLRNIMQRVRCDTPVLIPNSTQPINTAGHEPEDPNIDTILRVLNIDNDLVRNQLIINQSIEQICLIRDPIQANDFLYRGQRPKNVKAVLAKADDGAGIRYEYSRSGAEKSSQLGRWEGVTRIQTDREEQIRVQRENVNQAQRDLDSALKEVREKELALKRAGQAIEAHKREASKLKVRVQQAEDAVDEQNNLIEKHRPQDGKLQELERQLAEVKSEHEALTGSWEDCVNARDELNVKQKEVKTRLDAAQAEFDRGEERIKRAKERMDDMGAARFAALQEKNEALGLIDQQKKHVRELEERRDRQQTKVDAFIGEATNICAHRVPVDEGLTAQMIDDKMDRFTADLQRIQREAGGDRETLTLAWQKAETEHQEAKASLDIMKNFKKLMSDTLTNRRARWAIFQRLISVRTRATFSYLLSERNFRGNVLISHTDKLLDIAVEPDSSRRSHAGREAKTLSGGEKSFSTICLLLSIWEAMGSPLRCLDEFDVFMDNVNRATSMGMMIQAARRAVGRQFILITPQSMQNVAMGPDVVVHKMSDPERGQEVLPFTRGA